MALNVKRNTILLAAALAVNSCLLQLAAAVNSLTFVQITGIGACSGSGRRSSSPRPGSPRCRPGARWTLRAASGDRRGFVIASPAGSLVALATRTGSPRRDHGMALTGARGGSRCSRAPRPATCTRPSAARAGSRTSSFGSVFGRSSGRRSFAPIFAGKKLEPEALTLPWLVAGGLGARRLARSRSASAGPEADRRAARHPRRRAAAERCRSVERDRAPPRSSCRR
jgi:hypothetical protein